MTKPESPSVESGQPTVADPELCSAKKVVDLRKFGAYTVPPGFRAEIACVELPSMPADRFKDTLPPSDALEALPLQELRRPAGLQGSATKTRGGLGSSPSTNAARPREQLATESHKQTETTSPMAIQPSALEPSALDPQQRVVPLRVAIVMVVFAVSLVAVGFAWFGKSMNRGDIDAGATAAAASEAAMAATSLPSERAPVHSNVTASSQEVSSAVPTAPRGDEASSQEVTPAVPTAPRGDAVASPPKAKVGRRQPVSQDSESRAIERKRRVLYNDSPK
ncbi:MAG: hypothetical protein ACM3ZE_22715 [Myxococcales bacterium]